MYQQSRIVDGSTTGVIPPTRELLTTALPPQRCGGLDLRNGGWTFSTFCSHGQMLFRNIRRFTATFALDMLSAYGFRTVVSLREKTTASNSSVLEHPARLFFFQSGVNITTALPRNKHEMVQPCASPFLGVRALDSDAAVTCETPTRVRWP